MIGNVYWQKDGDTVKPFLDGKEVAWAPFPGSQADFLRCPIPEVLLEGNRGGGKTEALLMDFGQHVGAGFGAEWKGVLFRRTYPQLRDVVEKTQKWFPRIWPDAKYNASEHSWRWPDGEVLYLSYMDKPADYWNHHGHNRTWFGWEELTSWPDDKFYKALFSCWRSPHPAIPKKIRATTNPHGPGHNWVKMRFKLPVTNGRMGPLVQEGTEPARIAISSRLSENIVLMESDPNYINAIAAGARSAAEKAAWVEGSWDIVSGGMFDDVWSLAHHVIPNFTVPSSWRLDKAFDWGSSRPFSVGWWAESDGSDLLMPDGSTRATVRGDLFRVREWYGCIPGSPNEGTRTLASEISKGIIERELDWDWYSRMAVGPADSQIFAVENGMSIAGDMAKAVRVGKSLYRGVKWAPADKRPGSRKTGWELMRKAFAGSAKDGAREVPGLFICEDCHDFIRTVPVLPRALDKDPDDVDTDAEDHIADETRYRIRFSSQRTKAGRVVGLGS